MFKTEFQGGPYVDVYSIQGKDPLSKIKIAGPQAAIRKEFDNDLRTFTLLIEGEPSRSKITIPKNSKVSLHLTQQYLVFQLYIYPSRPFSLEVSVTNEANLKQRIILSNSNREIVVTALHAKMPCSVIKQNSWLNLCLDLHDLISGCFEGSKMVTIDSIIVSANCKLKRMFTLKTKPFNNNDIPSKFQSDDSTPLQTIDMNTFFAAGINIRCSTGNMSNRTAPIINRSNNDNSHIAFGSRVRHDSSPGSKGLDSSTNSTKLNSSRVDEKTSLRTRRDSSSSSKVLSTSATNKQIDADKKETSVQRSTENDSQRIEGKTFLQPRPPKQAAGKVRKPRIKSADYSRRTTESEQLGKQPLSKSADTRRRRIVSDNCSERFNRRRSSVVSDVLPEVKLQKRLSHSAVTLEHTEKLISESRENHFKSLSLNALPQIQRNKRYENTDDQDDDELFDDKRKVETPLHQLGDDDMVEDYLRRRTTSASSLSRSSSCANSTNSDLFSYSSRPRSVTGQRSRRVSETEMEKINEKQCVGPCKTEIIKNGHIKTSSRVSSASLENGRSEANAVINGFLAKTEPIKDESVHARTGIEFNNHANDATFVVASSPVPPDQKGDSLTDSLDGTAEFSSPLVSISKVPTSPQCSSPQNELTVDNVKNFNEDNNTNNLQLLNSYKMRESCDSDSMSWLHASDDQSTYVSDKNMVNRTLDNLKQSPKLALTKHLEERLGSLIVQSEDFETDDGFSDCSDETSIQPPPTQFRNYRYQDEIKSIGTTLDLSATIPETPQVGDQARINSNRDENNNQPGTQIMKLHASRDEELLDLLFDPVLNCYYDPVTHKYYELS